MLRYYIIKGARARARARPKVRVRSLVYTLVRIYDRRLFDAAHRSVDKNPFNPTLFLSTFAARIRRVRRLIKINHLIYFERSFRALNRASKELIIRLARSARIIGRASAANRNERASVRSINPPKRVNEQRCLIDLPFIRLLDCSAGRDALARSYSRSRSRERERALYPTKTLVPLNAINRETKREWRRQEFIERRPTRSFAGAHHHRYHHHHHHHHLPRCFPPFFFRFFGFSFFFSSRSVTRAV